MGFWGNLRNALLGEKPLLSWHEPGFKVMALRGDLVQRLFFAAAVWGSVLAVAWIAIPDTEAALWVGLIAGGVFGLVTIITPESKHSGSVSVFPDRLEHVRQEPDWKLGGTKIITEKWPYAGISQAIVVPREHSGKRFSVLIILAAGQRWTWGIAKNVDIPALVQFLAGRGVQVQYLAEIPAGCYPKGRSRTVQTVGYAVAGVLALAALVGRPLIHGAKPPQPPPQNDFAQQQPPPAWNRPLADDLPPNAMPRAGANANVQGAGVSSTPSQQAQPQPQATEPPFSNGPGNGPPSFRPSGPPRPRLPSPPKW